MVGTLTVYYSTGFNGIDIPADPSVLQNALSKTYNDIYYTREDLDKPYFDVKDTYEQLADVDYLAFTQYSQPGGTVLRTCYYFAVPTAITRGVTRLSCDLDALLTMGGAANLNYSSGWQERGHISKAEDDLFTNMASEDWMPTQPLYVAQSGRFGDYRGGQLNVGDLDVVTSSVDLYSLGSTNEWTQEVIEGIPTGDVSPVMYFPAIPVVTEGTEYAAYDFIIDNDYKTYSIPASAAFNYGITGGAIQKGLKKLFSAGQLQLQASYRIPGQYLDQDTTQEANPVYSSQKPGQIQKIRGLHNVVDASTYTFEYTVPDYTVKNKKCFATYRQFVLTNIGSSDTCIKQPEELYDPSHPSDNIKIWLWADPSSTGKPFARFKYIKDNVMQYADAVKGLQWNSNQIMMEGASGSLWNSIDAAFNRSTLERQQSMTNMNASFAAQQASLGLQQTVFNASEAQGRATGNLFGSVAGEVIGGSAGALSGDYASAIGSMGKIIGTSVSAAQDAAARGTQLALQSQQMYSRYLQGQANADMNLAQIRQAINENKIGLLKNNSLVAPTVLFTPEQNLGLYGYNYFVLYEIRKTNDDLKSEDEYYQRFGYNGLHRPLTASCFNTRQYYTFVQAFNVNIKSAFGLRIRQKAISQLNSGVRVWKVLPDAQYYETN